MTDIKKGSYRVFDSAHCPMFDSRTLMKVLSAPNEDGAINVKGDGEFFSVVAAATREATPAEIAAGHRIDGPSAFIEHCQQCADEVVAWPEDKKKAASVISATAYQSALVVAKEIPGAERTVMVAHCQHGVLLYGRECIQCSRESEQ